MNAFQIIVLPVVALLFAERVAVVVRSRHGRAVPFFWAALWLACGTMIAAPGLTTDLGKFFGIDRGADFVFYCAILMMFVGFFMTYSRMRRLETSLTQLVRQLALENAKSPEASPPASKEDRA